MIPFNYTTIINFSNFKITEPVTVLTDILVSIFAFFLYYRFKKHINKKHILHWGAFFLFIGLSALAGALSHGLKYYISERFFVYLWLSMQMLTGVAMFFAQQGSIEVFFKHNENESFLKNLTFLQLLVYIVAVFLFKNFMVTVVVTAVSLFPIMVKNFTYYLSSKSKSNLWLAVGIAISFLTAFINGAKLSIHKDWFNYKDISHILITCSICVMAYGILYQQPNKKTIK